MQLTDIKNQMTLPVMMAPMFLISNPNMVIRGCESGIIGTFPALNARTTDILDEWMTEINTKLDEKRAVNPNKKIAPWGINFISHSSNKRFYEDLKLIEKHQPPIVITSLGDPSPVVSIVHSYGGMVLSDVINLKFAKKALEKGSDGLILVANGAGGHGGTLNPFAFIQEVRTFFNGPIALAGAISQGEQVLASQILGADFAYIGTHFIATEESGANEEYRQSTIEATSKDILYTPAFSGIPANYLIPSIVKSGLDPNKLPKKEKIDFSELGDPSIRAWKDIWGAGQGVAGTTKVQSIQQVVDELQQQYEQAKNKMGIAIEQN
ncbi:MULTISPECIES: nitronate monooxygenase [Oceanobacillus]|uniref:Probable nitronate monooxygenase n=1 Tax=Oceanobacillus kimchii TaxID=746691 RepID=A0ABQ5TMD5_9BACI|nr:MULTISPECIES: nitronate monooxygenase [Oceanobacillus]MBT2600275.1 nitronate monooxygenase [Oceanobacillus sp. ISL-74]MBT2650433.1 nitronate monooxygenase [Oceanobacillus sp. ISL-73]MCT1578176.1 nitronate monooxygenase [Oceanobacillus kimchii]MCT2134354.1 nitronate monooxygenase [Oceanobacillus kimchii]GLO67322.1 2-nitropropane dioxygenase [Oceanobacillus kimchii]